MAKNGPPQEAQYCSRLLSLQAWDFVSKGSILALKGDSWRWIPFTQDTSLGGPGLPYGTFHFYITQILHHQPIGNQGKSGRNVGERSRNKRTGFFRFVDFSDFCLFKQKGYCGFVLQMSPVASLRRFLRRQSYSCEDSCDDASEISSSVSALRSIVFDMATDSRQHTKSKL